MQLLSYIGVILLFIFKTKGTKIKIPNYLIFYLLFIFYEFYSTFELLGRDFKYIYLLGYGPIGGFNMLLIIENIKIKKREFEFIFKWSRYVLIIAIITIILQQTVDSSIFSDKWLIEDNADPIYGPNEFRLHSIYSWIDMVAYGFVFVPIFILIVEQAHRNKKSIIIWITAGILYAFFTKSRWILLNSLFVFLILIINEKYKIWSFIRLLIIIPVISIGVIVLLNIANVNVDGILKDRILESNKKEKSAGTRLIAFEAFNRLYWQSPLFGKGNIAYGMGGIEKQDYQLRSFLRGRSSQIHVGYLMLFYSFGIIGGFFFLAFLTLLLTKLYKDATKTTYWGPFLAVMGFALANLTLVMFSIFHIGFIFAMVANKYYIESQVRENSQIL